MQARCSTNVFSCKSGTVKVVVCPYGTDITAEQNVKADKFTSVAHGSIASSFERDWSKAYFLYISPEGGGFYLEGDLDAFDDPECGAHVVPYLVATMKAAGIRVDPLLEIILSRRVFRSAYPI